MSRRQEESILNAIVQSTAAASGEPVEKIQDISSQMIAYINEGAPYGMSPEGCARWYIEKGGKL
ncbi:TPA: hypothetical protein ROY08_001409 [Bacillus cereus]|nr:hypothetical protein [Bacillus cereus]